MRNIFKVALLSVLLVWGGFATPLLSGSKQAEAASVVKFKKTAYQTTAALNMRAGAGTKHKKVLTIPKGKTVASSERIGNWYKVAYTYRSKGKNVTKTGWVSGAYLKKQTPPKPAAKSAAIPKTNYQTTANVNMRAGAGTSYKNVLTVPKGKIVSVTEKKGSWMKASYTYKSKGKNTTKTGWISSSYLKEYNRYTTTNGTYFFTKKTAGLYSAPNTKKKAVYTIPANNGLYSTQMVINSIGQTWYRVSFNGKTLYVAAGNVGKSSAGTFAKTTYVAKKDSHVFASYGVSYQKLVKVPKGKSVTSTSNVGNWYKVTYAGKTGYVPGSDFSKPAPGKPEVTKPTPPGKGTDPVAPPKATDPKTPPKTTDPVTPPKITEKPISGKTFWVGDKLNIRKQANVSSAAVGTIPKGKFVQPTHAVSNGWYKVKYGGKTGYVSGGFIKEVRTGAPLNGSRTGYQFIDLRTKSPVTATQINRYVDNYAKTINKKSVLAGKGQAIINAANKYGINALYLAAHAIHESGYGTSHISLGKNNLFGFGAYDATPFVAAYRFSSIDQNIEYIARQMKATYLNPSDWRYRGPILGYSTKTMSNARIDEASEGMNFYYASDPNWGKAIAAHMERILPYDKNYYAKAKPNTAVFAAPSVPDGRDKFPDGIVAVAKSPMTLSLKKDGAAAKDQIKKGDEFLLLEKTNDYWVKVKFKKKEYWTKSIDFVQYKNHLTVKNLARATADGLNVRPDPSINKKSIGTLKLNAYVHLVLDKKGNPERDKDKKWHKIKMANGKTGWVSSQYLAIELK